MKRLFAVLGISCVMAAMVVSPATARTLDKSHSSKTTFKLGVVTDIGGLNDKSFNHLANLGRLAAHKKFGIATSVVESKAASDYVPNLTHFASLHYNLTIAVGFFMASAIYEVAKAFPKQKFAIIDAAPANAKQKTVNLKNVANLFFKEEQSGYLVGALAALMEKKKVGVATRNTIGVMGGFSIPSVNGYIAGYCQAAKKYDPGIKIKLGYSSTFTNQTAAKGIGTAQITSGADILFQVDGGAGLGYLFAAQQAKKYGIGVDSDQGFLGKYVITSAVKKVNAAVVLITGDTLHGHFKGGDHFFSLTNHATGFAKPSSVVPKSIVTQVKAIQKQILSGKITPTTNVSC